MTRSNGIVDRMACKLTVGACVRRVHLSETTFSKGYSSENHHNFIGKKNAWFQWLRRRAVRR